MLGNSSVFASESRFSLFYDYGIGSVARLYVVNKAFVEISFVYLSLKCRIELSAAPFLLLIRLGTSHTLPTHMKMALLSYDTLYGDKILVTDIEPVWYNCDDSFMPSVSSTIV